MNSYRKLCTEFYDIDKPNAPANAFAFYRAYVQKAGGPILEPMCGSGRFLLPLLEQGFSVDGADASADMLAACPAKAEQRGLEPFLARQFLHELDMQRQYALAFIPAGSFCLLTDPHQIRTSLERLHAHLLPGATLVMEIERLVKPPQDEPWGGRWVNRPDGGKLVISWLGRYDAAARVSHYLHRYEAIKDGQLLETEWEELDLRLYEIDELRALLESVGFTAFRALQLYGDNPPADTDDGIAVECRKP